MQLVGGGILGASLPYVVLLPSVLVFQAIDLHNETLLMGVTILLIAGVITSYGWVTKVQPSMLAISSLAGVGGATLFLLIIGFTMHQPHVRLLATYFFSGFGYLLGAGMYWIIKRIEESSWI